MKKCATCGAIFDPARLRTQLSAVEQQVADPNLWSNPEQSQKVMRERKRLETQLATAAELDRRTSDIAAYFELAKEGEDVTSELTREIAALREFTERLETETLLAGENDHLNAIVTIHPGAWGTESQDWADMLLRMYLRWAERQGFETVLNDYEPAQEAGIKSATFTVNGDFASPEIDEAIDIVIREEDLRIDTYRSGGAGGQHVNTTDSAVRLTQKTTGIVVACQNERSQHKNKDRAMKILRSKLYEYELEKKRAISKKLEDSKLDIDFGSQIRSYVLAPYQMVKDHRTKYETGDVNRVLDGDIGPFIRAFLMARRGEAAARNHPQKLLRAMLSR